jgi:hypothetical protein
VQVTDRVKPYLDHIGVKPEQAFDNMVQLDYLLRTGTPEEKAQVMQKLLDDYKVTLGTTRYQMNGKIRLSKRCASRCKPRPRNSRAIPRHCRAGSFHRTRPVHQ